MKHKSIMFLLNACLVIPAYSQLTVPLNGGNKKASVTERIGITDVTIHYDRPGVKGREGKIWGKLVYNGFFEYHFGDSHFSPWRAGANENTTIELSSDVKVESQLLPAGKYALFIAYDSSESILIFSKNSTSWGSFFYDEKEDALRVKVKPVLLEKSVEWLTYEFINQTENSATVALKWEKLMIPFKIEVDYIKTQLESFRLELRSAKAFTWTSWNQAAAFCADNNVSLAEGLKWAENSINLPYFGKKNFDNLYTKVRILNLMGKNDEADTVMKEALLLGNTEQINTYANRLLQQKKIKEALEILKINYKKNPNHFTTIIGLVKGYSANHEYKNALKYAQQALPLAPSPQEKSNVETMISKLKEGKDVN